MAPSTGLPRRFGIVVRALVPAALRDSIEGDLSERYAAIHATRGQRAADHWIRRQLLSLRPLRMRAALREARRGRSGAFSDHARLGATSGWLHDLAAGLRAFRARPGASATVVATVALAVGATTATFSVVHGVLLRPLPFPDPDRLARLWQTKSSWMDSPNSQLRNYAQEFPLSVEVFEDWLAAETGFAALGAYSARSFVHQQAGEASMLYGQMTTSGLFAVLGIEPQVGRSLLAADDAPGAARVAVLSDGLWRELFAGDPAVVGRELRLGGTHHTIVGVMPPGFQPASGRARLWVSLADEDKAKGKGSFLSVVGRLAPGVSLAEAGSRLAAVQERLAQAFPDERGDLGARAVGLLDSVVGEVRSTLWFLLGAVALVLLIASFNIANLLSVMSLGRRRELAVKAAPGAAIGRLVRGMVIESAVVSAAGGAVGLALAWFALPLLLRMVPASVPRHGVIAMDPAVLAFGTALTALTAVLVATLPALQAGRAQPSDTLRAGSRGFAGDGSGARVRAALVATEVALAFALLVGAVLLGTSFARLWSVDRGFATEGLLAVEVTPDPAAFPGRDDRDRFVRELREELRAIPGARVSATNQVPLSGSTSATSYHVERTEGEPEATNVLISVVLDDYFSVMGIPVLRGRPFAATDERDAPLVALINQAMARSSWPDDNPIGKRVREDDESAWLTVVGVVGDVRHQGLTIAVEPKLYLPAWQTARYPDHWVIRAQGDMPAVIDLARAAVASVSPSTPVRQAVVVQQRVAESVAVPRFRMIFVVGLSALAGVLALLGVFSVVTLSVTQRTREIGVRMALGARTSEVVRQVVGSGVRLSLAGVGLGLALSLPAARLVREFLFETEPTDPLTYAAIALGVLAVSAFASVLPARRAAAVDPVAALTDE